MDIDFELWTMEKSRIWCIAETEEEIAAREAALEEYQAVSNWCDTTGGEYTIIEEDNFYKVIKVEHNEDIEESADNGAESEAENGDMA